MKIRIPFLIARAAMGMALLSAATFAIAQAPVRFVGTITAISGTTLTVKTDAGEAHQVDVPTTAVLKQIAPGEKDLSTAQVIEFNTLATGDRVLVRLDPKAPAGASVALQIIAIKQADLLAHLDNIREDRTPEDLLFQVLVDWGVDLALPIATETLAGKTVFFVDGNALAACFDTDITEDLVKELAKRKPLRAVFRDSSYGSDSVKINVEQIFKLLSPATKIKSL